LAEISIRLDEMTRTEGAVRDKDETAIISEDEEMEMDISLGAVLSTEMNTDLGRLANDS
jgi:hypothetical protein